MSGSRKERGGIGSQRGTGSHFDMVVRHGSGDERWEEKSRSVYKRVQFH